MPVVLYGCETWSLTLREECRLRVIENRILRLIFARMGSGEGSTMRNHSLYRSPNIVRSIKSRILIWAGHVSRMKEGSIAFKILTGKRPLGRPRGRWENNVGMYLKEIGTNTRNWVD